MNKELQHLKDIEDFTESYWWPAYRQALKNVQEAPHAPDIIYGIIVNRQNFIEKHRWLLVHPRNRWDGSSY